MGKTLDVTIRGHDQLSGTMRDVRGSITDVNQALEIGGKIVRTVGEIYEATVGQAMEYAASVRDLSIATGEGAEGSSRLLQVLDDFGVSGDQLTTAMRALREQGINPSVESLARMSGEYLRLNPGLERQNFLAQNFGTRIGPQFARVMEQGTSAILARGEGIADGLILTQADIDLSEELIHVQDDLHDQWQGIVVTLSTGVLPGLVAVLTSVNQLFDALGDDLSIRNLLENFGLIEDEAPRVALSLEAINAEADELAMQSGLPPDFTQSIEDADGATRDLTEAQLLELAAEALLAGNVELANYYATMATQVEANADAVRSLIEQLDQLNGTTVAYTIQVNGTPIAITEEQQQHLQNLPNTKRSGGGHAGVDEEFGFASGGPLSPIAEVGEQGTEGIINGIVIPHDIWERMKALGLVPDEHFQKGGGKSPWPSSDKPLPSSEKLPWSDKTPSSGTPPPTIEDIIQEAAASESAALAATIPAAAATAASEQGKQQVAETRRVGDDTVAELRLLRREVAKLNRTLPTLVSDAVQRAM